MGEKELSHAHGITNAFFENFWQAASSFFYLRRAGGGGGREKAEGWYIIMFLDKKVKCHCCHS